jgi:hypothetical protein
MKMGPYEAFRGHEIRGLSWPYLAPIRAPTEDVVDQPLRAEVATTSGRWDQSELRRRRGLAELLAG